MLLNTTLGSRFKMWILFARLFVDKDLVYGGVDVSHCLICHLTVEQQLGPRLFNNTFFS